MFLHLFLFPFCFLLTHPSILLLSSYSLLFFPLHFSYFLVVLSSHDLFICIPLTSFFLFLFNITIFFPFLPHSHLFSFNLCPYSVLSIFLHLFLYSVLSFYTSSSPPPTASVCLESVIKQKTPHVEGEIEEVH